MEELFLILHAVLAEESNGLIGLDIFLLQGKGLLYQRLLSFSTSERKVSFNSTFPAMVQ